MSCIAVPVAQILKTYFPKMVEMHNYSPQNSVQMKMMNWKVLNKKVLTKIGLPLSNDTIENLANATPGTINRLLMDIKKKIDLANPNLQKGGSDSQLNTDEEVIFETESEEFSDDATLSTDSSDDRGTLFKLLLFSLYFILKCH